MTYQQISSVFDVLHMSMNQSAGLDFSDETWTLELRKILSGVKFIPVLGGDDIGNKTSYY